MDIATRRPVEWFVREAAASLAPGALVLDAGAGESPYKSLFAHAQYEAADVCERDAREYPHIDYQCDLTDIPVDDGRFDAVVCTQVLEHVPYPAAVLSELFRVLKPGGRLWISAPLAFEEHEVPYDFFRFTRYGWERLLGDAGFSIERIDWVQGYFATLAYQLNLARHTLPRRAEHYGGGMLGALCAAGAGVLRLGFGALVLLFRWLDRRAKYTDGGHCVDYCVVASKD